LPPFSFHLSGTNVAFMRQAEAIIRGDLDLTAARTNGAPPLIGGAVHLHDSVFLSDLRALIPGNVEVPDQRPPYFSITNALLADWRLAVKVTGDRFLKVRTTLFNGEISADLKLEGSLGTPRALGDVRIDSGIVRFPFGGLQVQQGLVALTSQNPYHPQLSVTAISTQFGYDIRMQVSGTADAPVIQFSSSPPLSSEQILLLLSAGELPQGTFSLTPQQRAQTLGMFLGRDLLSQLGIGDESEQRLTIHSGERIAETGKPTYSIEFKLTDTLSLVGEYDRFGDYNAGVKWRIYSK
jgi:translocation and assembly module TamB